MKRSHEAGRRMRARGRRVADSSSANWLAALGLSLGLGLLALARLMLSLQRSGRLTALESARRNFERQSEERLHALVEHSTDGSP